jgi:hypothetical protein
MDIIEDIKFLLYEQNSKNTKTPVDLILNNGNICLRSFHLIDFDESTGTIKGLTQQEEYSYVREFREPAYCYFSLEEIKETKNY